MAKNKTGLYIGLGIVGLGALYLLTRKPATTAPASSTALAPGSATSSSSGLLAQATNLITAASRLFGGGSSSPAPGTAADFAPVSLAPTGSASLQSVSPAAGINYINPSAPSIQFNTMPDTTVADSIDTSYADPFNSEA